MSLHHFFLLTLLFVCFSMPTLAQQTEEDPYADYSYLWEDSKAKEKEAKRKAKEEKKRQKKLQKMRKKGLLPESSLSEEPAGTSSNTLRYEQSSQQDTIRRPGAEETTIAEREMDSLKTSTDSLDSHTQTPFDPEAEFEDVTDPSQENAQEDTGQQNVSPETLEAELSEEDSKKERKKKALSVHRVEDFRSGMQSAEGQGSFNGGLTFTSIDNQYYAGLVLNPEFKIGKVGFGLNVPILYGLEEQSIRTEMFEDGVGPARLITYVRYGVQKKDPVYVKVGQLNNTMIGFGALVNNYTNTTSFEKRKVGLHYDFNIHGLAGIDGLYSDFNPSSFNLLAVRPYVRPLAWSGLPVINTFEFGATYVSDKDQTSFGVGDSASTYSFTREGISAFGLDMGLTLLRAPFIQIDLFASYSKLDVSSQALTDLLETTYLFTNEPSAMADGFQNGTGASAGLNFRFHFIADIVSTDIRIERLNYSDHYLPQFFDATYELNKDARIVALGSAEKMSGIYGSLSGHILQKVRLSGSLMLPDNLSESSPATLRVNADLERLADKFTLNGSYIKGNLSTLEDAFVFDERSLAKVRAVYHLNKFLVAGVDYFWAFTPTAEGYIATEYVSPYFGLSIDF